LGRLFLHERKPVSFEGEALRRVAEDARIKDVES